MKKRKKIEELNEVYVLYKSYTHGGGICKGQENDSWPSFEPTYTEHEILGACKTRPKLDLFRTLDYEAIQVDKEILSLEKVYLVYCLYTTGNTFQTQYGVLWFPNHCILPTETEAEKYVNKLRADKSHSVPWNGYFDSLQDIRFEEMSLK